MFHRVPSSLCSSSLLFKPDISKNKLRSYSKEHTVGGNTTSSAVDRYIYIHTSVHVRVSIFSWKDAIEHWWINNFAVNRISGLHRGGASKSKYFRFLLSDSGRYSMMKPARSHKESDCRRREGRFRQAVVCTRIKDRKITRRSS